MPQGNICLSQRAVWAAGQPIGDLMHRALSAPDLISLAAGFVDQQTLPVEPVRQAIEAVLANPVAAQAALQYGTTHGYAPLREELLARHIEADGMGAREANLSIEQVVLTAGSNQLLHLIAESILDPGDIVLCAAPTYLVFLGVLGNIGARSIGVATDEQGLIPEALEEQLRRLDAAGELPRVKAIYLVSYFDNPSGVTIPGQRRARIVEIVKRWSHRTKIHVIEDAAYRELRYSGEDEPCMRAYDEQGDTVIVTGSFSKSFSPGVRVGWGILPPDLVEPVCNQKGNIDFGSPNLSQNLMAKVLELGLFASHVQRIRDSYRRKLEAMLTAADKFLAPLEGVHWAVPRGGLYVWLRLPRQIESGPSGKLLERALGEGVLYVPGQYCYPNEGVPVCKNTIRLSFGVQSCEKIQSGIEALARSIGQISGVA